MVRVEVPFERAEPLFPFLSIGGDWRPFFPNDRVRIWLDERNWFPLRWDVYRRPAPSATPGAPVRPSRRALAPSVFSVRALQVSLDTPDAGVFEIPATNSSQDQGARAVELGEVRRATGFEPVAPGMVGGLDRYRVVLPRDDAGGTLVAYADGLAFLNLGETRSWNGDAPFGTRRRAGGGDLTHRWRGGLLRTCVAGPRPSRRDHTAEPTCTSSPTCRVRSCWRPPPRSRSRASGCPTRGRIGGSARRPPNASRSNRPCVRPVLDRAPDGAARGVRARERGAPRRRVRRRCDLYLRDKDADAGIGTIACISRPRVRCRRPRRRRSRRWRLAVYEAGSPPTGRSWNGSTAAVSLARRSGLALEAPGDRDLDRRGRDGAMSAARPRGSRRASRWASPSALRSRSRSRAGRPCPTRVQSPNPRSRGPNPSPRPSWSGRPAGCPKVSEGRSAAWTGSSAPW